MSSSLSRSSFNLRTQAVFARKQVPALSHIADLTSLSKCWRVLVIELAFEDWQCYNIEILWISDMTTLEFTILLVLFQMFIVIRMGWGYPSRKKTMLFYSIFPFHSENGRVFFYSSTNTEIGVLLYQSGSTILPF